MLQYKNTILFLFTIIVIAVFCSYKENFDTPLAKPLLLTPQVQSTVFDSSSNGQTILLTNSSNRTTLDSSNNITKYDPTNYGITYHIDSSSNDFYNNVPNITSPIYNSMATNWIPNYEQSVFFSKTTGLSTVGSVQ